ncbi:MAG: AAA family ATPase, partial [Shimia sp.]|nr:AAA family ATPase [Shimia sp.]
MTFEKTCDALDQFMIDLVEGKPQVSYAGGTVGDDFVLAPGRITIIGAPPGAGKTALTTQIAFEAMDRHPELTLCIANAEMEVRELLKRELSRRSGIGHKTISKGLAGLRTQRHHSVTKAYEELLPAIRRTRHMTPPFSCEGLEELLLVDPGILIVDYLQKFKSAATDARAGVDEVMTCLRELAMQGWAVLALSATTRGNSKKGGHDPQSLSLSSFKESGEIEFNADAAYVLRNKSEDHDSVKKIDLDCV